MYRDRKFLEIRTIVDSLSVADSNVAKKLYRVVDETEHFVRQYEVPGTVSRWNERISIYEYN